MFCETCYFKNVVEAKLHDQYFLPYKIILFYKIQRSLFWYYLDTFHKSFSYVQNFKKAHL